MGGGGVRFKVWLLGFLVLESGEVLYHLTSLVLECVWVVNLPGIVGMCDLDWIPLESGQLREWFIREWPVKNLSSRDLHSQEHNEW